jgi:aquaporin Z
MQKAIIEFIGTFFLVLVVGMTVGKTDFAPIAIGLTLMVMVYMGGHISGGHYNPAVTLGCFMRGATPINDAVTYWVVQLLGGLAGAAVAGFLGAGIEVAPGAGFSSAQALVNEILFTFALVFVVLNVATSKDHPNNSFYGLAIGCTVLIGAFAGGGISGGAYNPAVGLGSNLVKGAFGNVWLYLVGPLAGGALAAVIFRITNPAEFAEDNA